jgi:quinol monooxygenase YgiN
MRRRQKIVRHCEEPSPCLNQYSGLQPYPQRGSFWRAGIAITETVSATKGDEPGTLTYEWYVAPLKTRCHIHERYRDSAEVMIHLHTFDRMYAERLGMLMAIGRVALFGNASQEVVEKPGGEGTVFLLPLKGFTRT